MEMGLWGKARELERSPWKKIVTVGVLHGNDMILTGKRRDNGLWTSPGGHMDEGEDLMSAARREVLEETGIDLSGVDLHLVRAERLVSHRNGKPFVVFAFVANVNQQFASSKNDPDDEVSEWKWVKIHPDTAELQLSERHAKDDFILQHLALGTVRAAQPSMTDKNKVPQKDRSAKDVSDDLQNANIDKSPPEPTYPEPKQKTPEEMENDPEAFGIDENTSSF